MVHFISGCCAAQRYIDCRPGLLKTPVTPAKVHHGSCMAPRALERSEQLTFAANPPNGISGRNADPAGAAIHVRQPDGLRHAKSQSSVLLRAPAIRGNWFRLSVGRDQPDSGFLIFAPPVANIAPRSQIRHAILFEVWMLEIAVVR